MPPQSQCLPDNLQACDGLLFFLLDRCWARVIQVRLVFRDVRVASAFVDQLEND